MTVKEFTKDLLLKSLENLDNQLNTYNLNEKIELHCSGGASLLLYLEARETTHDIDAYFPENKKQCQILKQAIQKTAQELNLEHTNEDKWLNNDIQDMYRNSSSDIILFEGKNIVLKSVCLEEMLSQKITTSLRTMKDVEDAKHIVNSLMDKYDFSDEMSIDLLVNEIEKVKPMNDKTPNFILKSRINALKESIENKSDYSIYMEFPSDVLSKTDVKVKRKLKNRI